RRSRNRSRAFVRAAGSRTTGRRRNAESIPTRRRSADSPGRRSYRCPPGRDRGGSSGGLRRALLQPGAYGADIPEPPARRRPPRSHLHRMAVQTVDRDEGVLVRGIVAHEHRRPPAERVLLQELEHRYPLVLAGRLDLDDALPGLDAVRPIGSDQQGADQPVGVASMARRTAFMQRPCEALVYEKLDWLTCYGQ